MAGTDRKDRAPPLDPEGPDDPAGRFLDVAIRSAPRKVVRKFTPSAADIKLAEHLFTSQATSFIDLAEQSGVSRTTIWRTLQDREACAWIVAHATQAAELGLGAVHARLLHMALISRSSTYLELYLKRFDPEYQKVASPGGVAPSQNSQFNFFMGMPEPELRKFIQLKRREAGVDLVEQRSGPSPEVHSPEA